MSLHNKTGFFFEGCLKIKIMTYFFAFFISSSHFAFFNFGIETENVVRVKIFHRKAELITACITVLYLLLTGRNDKQERDNPVVDFQEKGQGLFQSSKLWKSLI